MSNDLIQKNAELGRFLFCERYTLQPVKNALYIAEGQDLKRGAVVDVNGVLVGTNSLMPYAVLETDCDTRAKGAFASVFVKGEFNFDKLFFADGLSKEDIDNIVYNGNTTGIVIKPYGYEKGFSPLLGIIDTGSASYESNTLTIPQGKFVDATSISLGTSVTLAFANAESVTLPWWWFRIATTSSVTLSVPSGYGFMGENLTTLEANKTYEFKVIANKITWAISAPSGYEKIGDKLYNVGLMPDGKIWMCQNLDFGEGGVYYNNDESTYGWNGSKYGKLYTWNEAVAAANEISGWHLPSADEWDALATAVGGTSVAGTKLKSTTRWTSGNGDDSYGFAAFPAGSQYSSSFYNLGSYAFLWTATDYSSSHAYFSYFNTDALMGSNYNNKSYGYSVRLVKD